jgi:hypothetical protein
MTESSSTSGRTHAPRGEGRDRSLLLKGERLRLKLDAPNRPFFPSEPPYSLPETLARLKPQFETLTTELSLLPQELRSDNPVIEVTLVPQYLSASAFPARLFSESGLRPVGTRPRLAPKKNAKGETVPEAPTKSVFLVVEDGSLERLAAILKNPTRRSLPKKIAAEILALQNIELASPILDLSELSGGDRDLLEVVLHPQVDARGKLIVASAEAVDRVAAFAASLGGELEREWVRSSDSLAFVPVYMPAAQIDNFRQHNGLRAIHAMPRLRALPAVTYTNAAGAVVGARDFMPVSQECLRVAVFDAGVNDSSGFWQGRVRNIVLGAVNHNEAVRRHGALVTSGLLYGHIDGPILPDPADMQIDHYEAVPQHGRASDFEMYWLLDAIEDVLRRNEHYDVVTICVAPHLLVVDGLVDRWTSTLDRLSYELQTLFVVAAGNNGEAADGGGQNRVLVPGDASNVLTIGAAAVPASPSGRAAYSAIGPGRPGAEIRPSGIAFGGTEEAPFIATDNDGTALHSAGTSCAAPLVTRSLADLCATIGRPLLSPVTMRAFAIHFAKKRSSHKEIHVGHGHFPTGYGFLHETAENEAHVLYTDVIGRDEFLPLSIPVPDGTSGRVKIELTLVTSTDVNAFDAVDYTKAGLEVKFRPNAQIYSFRKKDHKTYSVNTATNSARVAELLRQGWVGSNEPDSATIFKGLPGRDRSETNLRADGKWQSVRVASHAYQNASAKLHRPRIDITHIAREGGSLAYGTTDLDWALLVSITGVPGSNLYDHVRTQFGVLAPLPRATVQVRA